MDMNVDIDVIKEARTEKNWTQQQVAQICGLSLRTIQRIEKTGIASHESVSSLSAAFEIDKDRFVLVEKRIATPGISTDKKKIIKMYKVALFIIMAAQFLGFLGMYLGYSHLSASQIQVNAVVVSCSTLFSIFLVSVSAYKHGVIKQLLNDY